MTSQLLPLGWAVLGAGLGWGVGRLCLGLERWTGLVREPEAGERMGPTWLERWALPVLGAATFALFAARQGLTTALLIHSLWLLVMLQVLIFDLKHRLILDAVTFPTLVGALVLAHWSPPVTLDASMLGALFGGGVLLPLAVISDLLHGGRGFGWGDVKLGMVIGAVTGLNFASGDLFTLQALLAGALIGGVVSVALLATRRRGLRDGVPYGPFLAVGAVITLLFM